MTTKNRKTELRYRKSLKDNPVDKVCVFCAIVPGHPEFIEQGKYFKAIITRNKVRVHLGTFSTPQEAFAVYEQAAQRLHGEFARSFKS